MSESQDLDQAARHQRRMEKKKAVVDAAIARASIQRGLVLVLTGNGKGKSSSAFGMVARALGYGYPCAVFQFIKGAIDTGEQAFFSAQPLVQWDICGEGFTWETQNLARDKELAQAGWEKARKALSNPEIRLVVLDEITYLFNYGYLALEPVLEALKNRPATQHVVITGRAAKTELIELADTVSRVEEIKHAFRAGVAAQPGVDL